MLSINMKISSNFVLSIFVTIVLVSNSCADDSHSDFFRCLATDSIGFVTYTETNSSYQSLWFSTSQSVRNFYSHTLKPIAIFTPLEEYQIPPIVRCSKLYGIEIRTRSGGHDYEGLSFISESVFVILDMRNLRSVIIDVEKKMGWAQTGATLGELYYAIANSNRNLAFPAGACPTVGLGGHFSGGGFGMISRKFGLSIDHVIDARIVDVNGRVLDRESMGEDLFWAIRGGGGASFGVILAWKINLVSIPETVTVFSLTRTSEQNVTELVHEHTQISDKMDNNLVLRAFIRNDYEVKSKSTIGVEFKGVYLGRPDNLLREVQKNFPMLGLVRKDCIEMSWIDSIVYTWYFSNGSTIEVLLNRTRETTSYYKIKSDFLTEPIPKEGLLELCKRMQERSDSFEMQITPFGGRMNEISESELPFPHRLGTRYMIQYSLIWDQPDYVKDEDTVQIKWMREIYKYMAAYASKNPRSAYFNYRDLDVGSDDEENASNIKASIWGVKYFKNNFERLVKVKTKIDPTNFFKNEQSIPVSHDFDSKNIKEVTGKNANKIIKL